jgi:hypothetical protein
VALLIVGTCTTAPTAQSQPLTGMPGARKAENVVGPVPDRTVFPGCSEGCRTGNGPFNETFTVVITGPASLLSQALVSHETPAQLFCCCRRRNSGHRETTLSELGPTSVSETGVKREGCLCSFGKVGCAGVGWLHCWIAIPDTRVHGMGHIVGR